MRRIMMSAVLAMAIAAPMSAANSRNHNNMGRHDDGRNFGMMDRNCNHNNRPAYNNHCNHRPAVGSRVMNRPMHGSYVMWNGRQHWMADGVIYRMVNQGRNSYFVVVGYWR
ncbi:MAG: hypothetical protein Q4B68_07525 [Bacteroidales bacterium]|nr:hypothetical protein [Bacteroidales bacterium]